MLYLGQTGLSYAIKRCLLAEKILGIQVYDSQIKYYFHQINC